MTTLFWIAALLLLPILFILWLTESRSQRINRMRANGWTVTAIAKRYGCSRSSVRRWQAA
jgi:DNA invertase Pin-like site-specific DNA recombinase